MKPTAVVTVFLMNAGKVALVKRSGRVGTYRGLWSGISGYLEGDPDRHFRVELAEETSLTDDDYTLLRKAPPVAVTDAEQGREWAVYPFVCEVHDPGRIRLDWENTELAWVTPTDMAHLPTVPALWEVYVRVSELGFLREVEAFVAELATDKTSGARELALGCLDFLLRICRSSTAATAAVLTGDIADAARRLRRVRPSMVIIDRTLRMLLDDIPPLTNIDTARDELASVIERHRQALGQAVHQASTHLAEIVPEATCLMLHSYSSSIIHTLAGLHCRGCRVIVTESRPGLEGRRTAELCAQAGLSVRLITDASVFAALKDVDMVLMGADAVTIDGCVINKMGSAAIACCAHALGVPVYILAECRKIVPAAESPSLEQGAASDVWEAPPEGVMVANGIFERVPPVYIRGIILEDGIFRPGDITQKCCEFRAGTCR
jgi:translation initiation factor 2B subunit (eIF-2B alpha/beta/delta family)